MNKLLLVLLFSVPTLNAFEVSREDFNSNANIRLYHEDKSFYVQDMDSSSGIFIKRRVDKSLVDKDVRSISDTDLLKYLGRLIKLRDTVFDDWKTVLVCDSNSSISNSDSKIIVPFSEDTVRMLDGYLVVSKTSCGKYVIHANQRVNGGMKFGLRMLLEVVGKDIRQGVRKAFGSNKRKRKRVIDDVTEDVREVFGDEMAGITYATLCEFERYVDRIINSKHSRILENYQKGYGRPTRDEIRRISKDAVSVIRENNKESKKRNAKMARWLISSGNITDMSEREIADKINDGSYRMSFVPVTPRRRRSQSRPRRIRINETHDRPIDHTAAMFDLTTSRDNQSGLMQDRQPLKRQHYTNRQVEDHILLEGCPPAGIIMMDGNLLNEETLPGIREGIRSDRETEYRTARSKSFIKRVIKGA